MIVLVAAAALVGGLAEAGFLVIATKTGLAVTAHEDTVSLAGEFVVSVRLAIGLAAFGKTDWARVEQGLADDAWYTAKLLAGEMPPDICAESASRILSIARKPPLSTESAWPAAE